MASFCSSSSSSSSSSTPSPSSSILPPPRSVHHHTTDGSKVYGVDLSDIREASKRIAGIAHITPVLTSSSINNLSGTDCFFKCELFQKVGAFKFRGACSTIVKYIQNGSLQKGGHVVTHSSGNHAQALALAAQLNGVNAHIVMPNNSPIVKKNAVQGYGAKIYECLPTQADREKTADGLLKTLPGSVLIHPYESFDIIAGQGTIAAELLEQVKDGLDALIVPVGGGGMLSGICIAAKSICPSIRIFAAEPLAVSDCQKSFSSGERILLPDKPDFTVADGLRTSLGELTWPIIRDHIDAVLTVTEQEIVSSMKLIYERMKLVIEPSAAVGVAALFSSQFQSIKNQIGIEGNKPRVGIVLCGGNVDLNELPWIKK